LVQKSTTEPNGQCSSSRLAHHWESTKSDQLIIDAQRNEKETAIHLLENETQMDKTGLS
jgi:hypothetical protein